MRIKCFYLLLLIFSVIGCDKSPDKSTGLQNIQIEKLIENPKVLISMADELNSLCRGGIVDSPKTEAACDARSRVYDQLNKMNWCFGKEQEYGYQMKWHACKSDSLRFKN